MNELDADSVRTYDGKILKCGDEFYAMVSRGLITPMKLERVVIVQGWIEDPANSRLAVSGGRAWRWWDIFENREIAAERAGCLSERIE